jgi:hypothetical protein
MDKLHNAITLPKSASKAALAAAVSKARGDNATVTATQIEPLVLNVTVSRAALIHALKSAPHTQEAFQKRVMMARFYAMDWSDAHPGETVPPAMTEEIRARYAALMAGAAPDAKTLKEKQVRCTKEQWQRKSTLRTWFTRLLADAGLKTVSKRGGSRVKTGKTKAAKGSGLKTAPHGASLGLKGSTPAPLPAKTEQGGFAMPAVIKVQAPAEAANYYAAMATTLVKFTSANIKSKAAAPFEKLVTKFHRDVMALAKKCK